MKFISRFFVFMLILACSGVRAAPVPTTAGSNLTAYNPTFGGIDNNSWATMSNGRSGAASNTSAPKADFGNCESLILRCASPRCSGSGCKDPSVAAAIVSGCVNSNPTCKKYGDDLISLLAAQLVASSTANENQQASAAAAAAASAQNDAQLQAMQQQMQQTQQMLMEQTNAMNALQNELAQQQQANAQAIADAAAAATAGAANNSGATDVDVSSSGSELSEAQRVAAASGIDPNLVQRQEVSGQILSSLENVEDSMNTLKAVMENTFTYAGCDRRGNNCSGPKRVSVFKDKANQFFEPYDTVLDSIEEALFRAQMVGVDVTNIYQYLNNSCNQWAKYVCSTPSIICLHRVTRTYIKCDDAYAQKYSGYGTYDESNCDVSKGVSRRGAKIMVENQQVGSTRGGFECQYGMTVPAEDNASCQFIANIGDGLSDNGEVERRWLYPDVSDNEADNIRVGCASNALNTSRIFKRRNQRKKSTMDIDVLQRLIEQDAPVISSNQRNRNYLGQNEVLKYCAVTDSQYANLQRYVTLKGLPKKGICVNEKDLNKQLDGREFVNASDEVLAAAKQRCLATDDEPKTGVKLAKKVWSKNLWRCYNSYDSDKICEDAQRLCEHTYEGKWDWTEYKCTCKDENYNRQCTANSNSPQCVKCLYRFPTTGQSNHCTAETQ